MFALGTESTCMCAARWPPLWRARRRFALITPPCHHARIVECRGTWLRYSRRVAVTQLAPKRSHDPDYPFPGLVRPHRSLPRCGPGEASRRRACCRHIARRKRRATVRPEGTRGAKPSVLPQSTQHQSVCRPDSYPAPTLTEDIVLRDYAQRVSDFQTRLMRIPHDLMRSLLGRPSCWQLAEAHAGQIESQRQRHARANDEAGAERVPATACRMKARNADGTPAAFPSHETAWATSSKDHQHLKIECRQYSSSACGEPHANEQNPSNLAGTCCIVHQHIRYKQDTSNAT